MEFTQNTVVTGLEGCGKSSSLFEHVLANPDKYNEKTPVIFGLKNYALMVEQLNNWSERYKIPKEQFAIAGHSRNYQPALDAYTNNVEPGVIGRGVRYIFTSQACIQREGHRRFFQLETSTDINYSLIILDEFEFATGILPSLDYEFAVVQGGREIIEEAKLKWIEANYTRSDRNHLAALNYTNNSRFLVAHWLATEKCPVVYLTSEILSKTLLLLLGFKEINIGVTEFRDCVVNVWPYENLNRFFFRAMNEKCGWNKLNYDLVITDNVKSYFETNKDSLEINVLPHASIQGSNSWKNRNILTILSHIPVAAIQKLVDAFSYFGKDFTFTEVQGLFYRDRLCQAIGRVLGYRGSKETDVIVHAEILNSIQNFPYELNTNWVFNFDGFDEIKILQESKQLDARYKSEYKAVQKIEDLFFLEEILEKEDTSFVKVSDFKAKVDLAGMTATKVASYFQTEVKNKSVGGRTHRVIQGVKFK